MGWDLSEASFSAQTSDEADCEAASLLALIFSSPSEEIQLRMEPHLTAGDFDDANESAIVQALLESNPMTRLLVHGLNTPIVTPVPEDAVALFVSGLHITRKIPARLCEVIDRRVDSETGTRLRVILRNNRLKPSGAQCDFLSRFLKKSSPDSPDFFPPVSFCALFSERIRKRAGLPMGTHREAAVF